MNGHLEDCEKFFAESVKTSEGIQFQFNSVHFICSPGTILKRVHRGTKQPFTDSNLNTDFTFNSQSQSLSLSLFFLLCLFLSLPLFLLFFLLPTAFSLSPCVCGWGQASGGGSRLLWLTPFLPTEACWVSGLPRDTKGWRAPLQGSLGYLLHKDRAPCLASSENSQVRHVACCRHYSMACCDHVVSLWFLNHHACCVFVSIHVCVCPGMWFSAPLLCPKMAVMAICMIGTLAVW